MKSKRYRLGAISLGMLLAFGAIHPVQANIVADSGAAAGLRPDVTETSQGTALVNIQAPSAAGVSRNVYSEFNVDERGVILNNSRSDTRTVWLDEYVAGNAALANGEASIILNEVNSRNPSQLNGIIEVAGQRAEVVIANPSGISCSGCGFINASRAVLTTGQAQVENGMLTGYIVEDGAVTVEGEGLNGANGYTDIIARSVKINARVQAEALNITTGRNSVDAKNTTVTKLADSGDVKPELALDVTSLGSIYADKIRMIGTEKGVGVNHAGRMDIFDSVEITADGEIVNNGRVEARNGIQLIAQSVSNHGMINSDSNIRVESDVLNNAAGMLYSNQGDVTVKSGVVDNRQGLISGQNLIITADSVNNEAGVLEGLNNASLQVTSLKNNDGIIAAGSDLQLSIKDGVAPQGVILVAGTTIEAGSDADEAGEYPYEPAEPEENNDASVTEPEGNNDASVTEPEENNDVSVTEPEGNNDASVTEPEESNDATEESDGVLPDEHGVIGTTDEGVPIRDVGTVALDFYEWRNSSGFEEALAKLVSSDAVTTSAVWKNKDVLAYLYLTYTSGTALTTEILEGLSDTVFGQRPASESAQNIEQVRLIAELIGSCVAGNC